MKMWLVAAGIMLACLACNLFSAGNGNWLMAGVVNSGIVLLLVTWLLVEDEK